MNVLTMTMPKADAQNKMEAYRKALARMKHKQAQTHVAREYEAAVKGYEALAKGTPLIHLDEVIRAGGFDEKQRPKLAIALASRRQVHFQWRGTGTICEFNTQASRETSAGGGRIVRVDLQRVHGQREYWNDNKGVKRHWEKTVEGFALVPIVPADVAAVTRTLKDKLVLWEVEQWADQRIRATPDRDPFLLQHLGGSLYAVLAEWDLTDLERAVMAGRRNEQA